MAKKTEIFKLVDGLKPSAKAPKMFGLWSQALQVAWLRQNQRSAK